MIRQRSFSVDDGLANESPVLVGLDPEPKKYHGLKRLSVVLDAFSKKEMDKLESHTKARGKIPKSQSVHGRGDAWLEFINGTPEED